jgi:chromosome segregation ATPase
METIKEALDYAKQRIDELKAETAELKKNNELLKGWLASAEVENAELKKENENLAYKCDVRQGQIDSQQLFIKDQHTENARLREALETIASRRIDTYGQRIANEMKEIAEAALSEKKETKPK